MSGARPRSARRVTGPVTAAVLASLALAGCSGSAVPGAVGAETGQQGRTSSGLQLPDRPEGLTGTVDNPYLPLSSGTRWVYENVTEDGVETIHVTVLDRTKHVLGVDATVVRDVVRLEGELVEYTYDWYGQDRAGNVWYLGEYTKEYENGTFVGTEGSFTAGVDGAEPGIAMPAHPRPGQSYHQEYAKGEAEDRGRVLSVDEQVEVPTGHYSGAVMTRDTTPLEPRVSEHKIYAKGVGVVLELGISGDTDRTELVRYTQP